MAPPVIPNESYSSVEDLQERGAPRQFWNQPLTPNVRAQQLALNSAADEINSYISVKIPISDTFPWLAQPYDNRLIQANIDIAMFTLIGNRGYNPENPADVTYEIRRDNTVKWLQRVADGKAKIKLQPSYANSTGAQPMISSNHSRGLRNWSGNISGNGWGF